MSKKLVFVEGNQVKTDSLTIADIFGKRHDHVMRDIENQMKLAGEEFSLPNFGGSTYSNDRGKKYPKYDLTEEAFTLVVFSYNTKEAVRSKIQFIKEFKRMREFIQAQPNSLETALQAALTHERQIKTIQSDVSYLKDHMRVDGTQQQEIQQLAKSRVVEALGGSDAVSYQELSKKTFSAFWREFKNHFRVPRYGDLPKVKFDEAIQFINVWRPATSLQIEIDHCNQQMKFI